MSTEPLDARTRAGIGSLRPDDGPLFLAIGVFDGIHRGHLFLIERLVAEAAERRAHAAVLTFDSHPDELVAGAAPPLLVDPEERVRLLEERGVGIVIVEHFDAALRATEYDEFIERIRERTTLSGILMTPDAAFGRDRRGTPEAVRQLGTRCGFEVVVASPLRMDGDKVSSSAIRALIAAGDLEAAARLLGRPVEVTGVAADRRVTFPLPVALPPTGDYRAHVDGRSERVHVDREGGAILLERPAQGSRVGVRLDGPRIAPTAR